MWLFRSEYRDYLAGYLTVFCRSGPGRNLEAPFSYWPWIFLILLPF